MKDALNRFVSELAITFDGNWHEATKEEIEAADGRKDGSNPICKTASTIYVAYSGKRVLYVGETSKSIKRRFNSDGRGSHREACSWYPTFTHVRYKSFHDAELPIMHRRLVEQALSIHFAPEFYGSRRKINAN